MDRKKFTELFNDNVDAVHKFVYWRVGDVELASDIVSTVFTKAWEASHTFTNEYPRAWLFKIARNLVIDHYRKKQHEQLDEDNEPSVDDETAERLDKESANEKLRTAMSKLKPKSRQVLELRIVNELSAKEASLILDTTEENVRIMQFRALKELRKIYETAN